MDDRHRQSRRLFRRKPRGPRFHHMDYGTQHRRMVHELPHHQQALVRLPRRRVRAPQLRPSDRDRQRHHAVLLRLPSRTHPTPATLTPHSVSRRRKGVSFSPPQKDHRNLLPYHGRRLGLVSKSHTNFHQPPAHGRRRPRGEAPTAIKSAVEPAQKPSRAQEPLKTPLFACCAICAEAGDAAFPRPFSPVRAVCDALFGGCSCQIRPRDGG